jgi:hypothetical protein
MGLTWEHIKGYQRVPKDKNDKSKQEDYQTYGISVVIRFMRDTMPAGHSHPNPRIRTPS